MYRPDSSLAAPGIKVYLAGHKHRRLQDVAAASVVLETAIIKVHRRGQGLKIESNCKNSRMTEEECPPSLQQTQAAGFSSANQPKFHSSSKRFSDSRRGSALCDVRSCCFFTPSQVLFKWTFSPEGLWFVHVWSVQPSAASRRASDLLHGRTETPMQAARPEGRSVLASRFDRIFTIRCCSLLNLKNPL